MSDDSAFIVHQREDGSLYVKRGAISYLDSRDLDRERGDAIALYEIVKEYERRLAEINELATNVTLENAAASLGTIRKLANWKPDMTRKKKP